MSLVRRDGKVLEHVFSRIFLAKNFDIFVYHLSYGLYRQVKRKHQWDTVRVMFQLAPDGCNAVFLSTDLKRSKALSKLVEG